MCKYALTKTFALKIVSSFSEEVLSASFLLKSDIGTRRRVFAEVGKMLIISKQAFKSTFPFSLF